MTKGKFIEGQIYKFLYIKDVLMEEEFMVFEDDEHEKYLLPKQYFKTYNLEQNTHVDCLISRIDCKGKITIEPEHPYYKPGEIYDFDFVKMLVTEESEFNPVMEKTYVKKDYEMIVLDIYGIEHRVIPKRWQRKKRYTTEKVKCKLLRIMNGRFQLINMDEPGQMLNKVLKTLITKINFE
jgi:hypothetical protein